MAVELKQVLRYPGSKARIAPWIVSHFPKHESYLEPFCGSAVVLMAKPRSPLEMLNDRDGRVTTLFRVIRDRPEELARAIEATPWARDEYEVSLEDEGDAVERARRFLVRCWQGFNSSTADDAGWENSLRVVPAGIGAHRWLTIPDRIALVTTRLKGVQIENRPADALIRRAASPNVLIYADPPYVTATPTNRRYAYDLEGEGEHRELLRLLKEHPGPVLISAYNHPAYEEELSGWVCAIEENRALNSVVRQEVLWLNPVAARGRSQTTFDLT